MSRQDRSQAPGDEPSDRAERPSGVSVAAPGPRQPWLHDLTVVLRAPTQAWSGRDAQMHPGGAEGVYQGDVRVLSQCVLTIDGVEPDPVAMIPVSVGEVRAVALARGLGDPAADPTVRVDRVRRVGPGWMEEMVTVTSTALAPVAAEVVVVVAADLAPMRVVKAGAAVAPVEMVCNGSEPVLRWGDDRLRVTLEATGARASAVARGGAEGRLTWQLDLPGAGAFQASWRLSVRDPAAQLRSATTAPEWQQPGHDVEIRADDSRLAPWVARSLEDLAALVVSAQQPEEPFLAAGAPWYLTLFGRDSLWAARMLLPVGTELAASTLRLLATRQGRVVDTGSAEAPGKILHEVRSDDPRWPHVAPRRAAGTGPSSVYFGTVDATPLWVILLHDAWRWGLPAKQVEPLLPHLEAALAWMVEYGDADGDGFLEYVDDSGRGLTNQGWKDSYDAVQWHHGSLARAPIALCEVQGYAFQAARSGAAVLEAFGRPGTDRWREWAERLGARFRAAFWVAGEDEPFPAIALDADKRPVDTLTSNAGHLLGTGLLDPQESAVVAARLTRDDMSSGFGLRTLSTRAVGYRSLGYHTGSVWPHDTAIVLSAMASAGRHREAAALVGALLAAADSFDYRLPELFGGDDRAATLRPVPYPAACRPQAWSAASAITVLRVILGLDPDVPDGTVRLAPLLPSPVGAVEVDGLRLAGEPLRIALDRAGSVREVSSASSVAWSGRTRWTAGGGAL